MELSEIQWLRAALPAGRTLYRYYKDRYSLQLLRYAVPQSTPLARLRSSPVAGLLQKPRVSDVLASCDGRLSPAQLLLADGDPAAECYTLSLGTWRGSQMSRRGANLVLRLDFARSHDRPFLRLVKPDPGHDPFNYNSHPVTRGDTATRRYTLAWVRLDIDLDNGEALIEEIQSDWVRRAQWALQLARRVKPEVLHRRYGIAATEQSLQQYCEQILAGHAAMWDEAMLSATLFFLREELGMERIYFHTPQSGKLLKNICASAPPRSIYTDLPRRFCFRGTDAVPGFLARDSRVSRLRRRNPALRLQQLSV